MTESEWLTRKSRIDSKLSSLSPAWKIIRYKDGMDLSRLDCHAGEEFPTNNGPADDKAPASEGLGSGGLDVESDLLVTKNFYEDAGRERI